MKNIDEQMQEVLRRSKDIRREKLSRRYNAYMVLAACAGIAIIVFAAAFMPVISGSVKPVEESMYGSIVLVTPFLGYIVIGVLAFVLGFSVAALCIHFNKRKQQLY